MALIKLTARNRDFERLASAESYPHPWIVHNVDSKNRNSYHLFYFYFSEADSEWIQAVTGVNTTYRKWTGYTIDVNIQPRPGFQTKFEEVARAFHQQNEAGRRIFLNLFLSDIILREEFGGALRIFPELQVTVVETNGPKKPKLNGITDYTVGFGKGKDIFDNTIVVYVEHRMIPVLFDKNNLEHFKSWNDFPSQL